MRFALTVAAAALLAAPLALAQNPLQNSRSVVASPTVLGMGDAAVAFPTNGSSFFYNPAHVVRTTGFFPRFQLGVQGRGSQNLRDYYDFVQDDLRPAVDKGMDNLTSDEIDTLQARLLRATRKRGYAVVDAPLSVAMKVGPVAFGAGGFLHIEGRLRGVPGPVPVAEISTVRDGIAIATAAVEGGTFGLDGLAVGANVRYTNRAVAIKEKPVDAWSEGEQMYLHEASALSLDLGLLYDLPVTMPGRLTAGAAVYDAAGGRFDYAYKGRFLCVSGSFGCVVNPSMTPAPPRMIAQEDSLARLRFGGGASYRVGVAYTAPTLFGLLTETGVALDYVGYARPQIPDQPFLAHLNIGAQAQLARILALRVGLNQGYASLGAGLKLGPLALDYAFYAFEQGRKPGEDPSWQHLAAMRLVF